MGILHFNYHCNTCHKSHASYFDKMHNCFYCGSTDVKSEDIRDKKIERYSDLGREMYGNYKDKEEKE